MVHLRVLFILVLFCTLSGCNKASSSIDSSQLAYAVHFVHEPKFHYMISQINLQTNEIIKEIKINKVYQNLTLLENGSLLMSNMKDDMFLGNEIDRFDPTKNRVSKFSKTNYSCPMSIIPWKDKLIAMTGGNYSGPLSFEIFNQDGTLDSSIFVHKSAMLSPNSIHLDTSRNQLLIFPSEFDFSIANSEEPYFYIIDLIKKRALKQHIDIDLLFKPLNSISFDDKLKKLYVSAGRTDNAKEESFITVLDYPSFKEIKKIKIPKTSRHTIYLAEEQKLYAQLAPGLAVIDTKTDTLINVFNDFHIERLSYVGDSKLLFSTNHAIIGKIPGTNTLTILETIDRLFIYDTKSDTVIKEFEGHYGPISMSYN
jgi:hypothetical protein